MSSPKLLLVSNGFTSSKVKALFLRELDVTPQEARVVIIPTASKDYKKQSASALFARDCFIEMGFSKIDFLDVEFDSLEELERYDIIYLSGGNPFYLLMQVVFSGCDHFIFRLAQQGRFIVGTSAGAMILGKTIELSALLKPETERFGVTDATCLGFVPYYVLPHAQEFEQDQFKAILEAYQRETGVAVLKIRDDEGVFVHGSQVFRIEKE